jgi:hypothetical protein
MVMEYEPESLVPNIDDHIFAGDDCDDKDGGDDEEQELTLDVDGAMLRPCLMDLVKVGRDKLKEMNVKKIRMVAEEHSRRKRTTTKKIDRVKSMKEESLLANIAPEQDNVEDSVWTNYLRELRYEYYD